MTREIILNEYQNNKSLLLDTIYKLSYLNKLNNVDTKNQGVTYTPWDVAYKMVEYLDIKPEEKWLDTSIGRGIYLWATLEYLKNTRASLPSLQSFLNEIQACEWDAQAAQDTRDLLKIWCSHNELNYPTHDWLQVGDSLDPLKQFSDADVLIGNPPYVRIQNLYNDIRDNLKKHYESCQTGNVDLYYAFFEHALKVSKRGSLIAPNSWLVNNSASSLRKLIKDRTISVRDFYNVLLFSPVRTYTAIWTWNDKKEKTIKRFVEWSDDYKTQEKDKLLDKWTDPNRFVLKTGTTLSEFADVYSGVATLADKVYSGKIIEFGKDISKVEMKLDGSIQCLETKLLVPCYKFTKDTNALKLQKNSRVFIYPYNENGELYTPEWMNQNATNIITWLNSQKNILDSRDKGLGKYSQWYAYGRKQGLFIKSNDAIGISTMWSKETSPLLIEDPTKPYVFVSGYILVPKQNISSSQLIAALKKTDVWEQVKANGKIWAGDKPYRTMGAPLLRNLLINL